MTLRRKEPRALVEQEQALNYAQMAVRRAWAGNVEDMQNWATAEFDPTPLVIFDLNGEPLFYEFTVRDGRQMVGRVKAAASRLIGSAVVTIERGARKWDPEKAMAMAADLAKKAFPRRQIAARDLVCYSYPKIGVRVEVVDERAGSLIYDVADGSLVQEFGSDALEGQTAWSFLESMSPDDLERRLRRFQESTNELEAVRRASPEMFSKGFTAREVTRLKPKFVIASDYLHFEFYSSRVLKYAPRCTPHDCFALYAQQTNVYCAVATGEMILDFYRYYFDQPTIAAAMGTGASGTSFAGQVTGYQTLSNGCLTATHDSSADWTEARTEINANRPLKSGISGHARACAGWKRQNFTLIGGPPVRWLQIYDPWPWNADICAGGAVYWEDWDAITHTNCYVRHNTTSHA